MTIDINENDFYKILDIDEDANLETINKAYRKLAKDYHPNKFSNIEEKNRNEKIFLK